MIKISYINEISMAVSPYVARSKKAIEFYKANKDKNTNTGGLFLAVGNGPDEGWEEEATGGNPPLPDLSDYEIENIQCFKRYRNMFFVISNASGKINVGDMNWSKIKNTGDESKYYTDVINQGSRWIYIDFEIASDELISGKIRQIGVYSYLKLIEGVDVSKTFFNKTDILQLDTSPTSKRKYDGILELIQNKEAYEKPNEGKEVFAFVLEF